MSTNHGTTAKGPWETALWGVLGLNWTLDAGQSVRNIKMPTMQAWPLIGASWIAMAAIGITNSWYAYLASVIVGLFFTECADVRATRKDSLIFRTSRWREAGTWLSFFVGMGVNAHSVIAHHAAGAVNPLFFAAGLLALFVVKYVAHQVERGLRRLDEIGEKIDKINDRPEPEPEPAGQVSSPQMVINIHEWQTRKAKSKNGRHHKAA
ncbi:hypothetical protein [Amycolatopsis sp.]|jgi:hypothetical protein|uniref:hypothetical protein n=1 Tax=Amycolatopsis sp. TaxID=37632 RepID=UPI002E06E69B|nr:hypothetical protein [Amycolatopsis sp.]